MTIGTRTSRSNMLRRHVICIYVGVLAAWMQFLAPVAAMKPSAADPFVICTQSVADPGKGAPPAHHSHQGDCCVLCHTYLGVAPFGERPAFTAFDYPVAGPMRWRVVRFDPLASVPRRGRPPRGPPSLV